VAGIQEIKLCFGQVAAIGLGPAGGENLVVLAPNDQRRRLKLTEEGLKLRVEADIAAVIPEQVKRISTAC
jgi:hypothetical protein